MAKLKECKRPNTIWQRQNFIKLTWFWTFWTRVEGLEDDARPYKDPTSLTSDQEKQKFKQNMNYCRIRADVHQIYDKRKPRGLKKLIMKKSYHWNLQYSWCNHITENKDVAQIAQFYWNQQPTILKMQPYHWKQRCYTYSSILMKSTIYNKGWALLEHKKS